LQIGHAVIETELLHLVINIHAPATRVDIDKIDCRATISRAIG
jgi:hypothetical protein